MTGPLAQLVHAHSLLRMAIDELRRVRNGRFVEPSTNGPAFGDADRLIIEADAAIWRATTALAQHPLRITDCATDGVDPEVGPAAAQLARAVDHINRLHDTRTRLRALIAAVGGPTLEDDRPHTELERKWFGKSAQKGAAAQSAYVAVMALVGALALLAALGVVSLMSS